MTTTPEHRDYFISRSTRDVAFAQWIGKLIAAQGKSYVEQSEHFGHEDFMLAMHKAMLSGAKTVALYSQSYLDSKYCVREATEALKRLDDPGNEKQQLIPLRIEPCAPAGMLNVGYTDLLAERRQADASALAVKVCRALGLGPPDLGRLPPLPEGLLTTPPRIIQDSIRTTRTDLAPRPELMAGIASAMSREDAIEHGSKLESGSTVSSPSGAKSMHSHYTAYPESVILVFIGFSDDARTEAEAVLALRDRLQEEVLHLHQATKIPKTSLEFFFLAKGCSLIRRATRRSRANS